MKNIFFIAIIFAFALIPGCNLTSQNSKVIKHENRSTSYAVQPAFSFLKFGEVKPTGWILEQMQRDLKEGFAGHYDEVAPEARTDVFGKEITARAGADFTQWWDAETQGRWRKGLAMLAYLTNDAEAKKKVDTWFDHILTTQDSDGYLGVYKSDERYNKTKRELCDLGTQAFLFKAMAAYIDLSGRKDILNALIRGVDRTIAEYANNKKHVFPDNTHDLLFIDVLDWLYARTGDSKYTKFSEWLFMDYTNCPELDQLDGDDSRITFLLNKQLPFMGHGPHTISQVSMPWFLYYTTGNPLYYKAGKNALAKIISTLLPSGIPVSQEFVIPMDLKLEIPKEYHYEYCSVLSMMESYESIFRFTGTASLGDDIEKAFFNGAQSARLSNGLAISYLTSDTRLSIKKFEPGKWVETSLAPNHIPACCNPSATQISGQYVRGMWMRTQDDGLAATLYGPCILETTVNGISVTIEERTNYPFEYTVEFTINTEKPINFPVSFRIPKWSLNTQVICKGATISRSQDYFVVSKTWESNAKIKITLTPDVEPEFCGGLITSNCGPFWGKNGLSITKNGGLAYLTYGPLVFAQPISPKGGKPDFGTIKNFKPQDVLPENPRDTIMLKFIDRPILEHFGFNPKQLTEAGINPLRPFDKSSILLEGEMINKEGEKIPIQFAPIGSSEAILRRVAFPVK